MNVSSDIQTSKLVQENPLLSVWISDETLFLVFDILLKVTEQVRGSILSKFVIFDVHNLCGEGFLIHKKKSEIPFHSVVI